MAFLNLHVLRDDPGAAGRPDAGAQDIQAPLTDRERGFIEKVAFPLRDVTKNNKALEKLTDSLWNLCLWERQRTIALDTKAASLTNLSGLAAAVIAASTVVGAKSAPVVVSVVSVTPAVASITPAVANATPSVATLVAMFVSIALFIVTVALSLFTQRVVLLGGFLDVDVFGALGCSEKAVGDTPAFTDKDEYRCYLRETALQRWLVYRRNCDQNDAKYRRLRVAQWIAALAVLSLVLILASRLLKKADGGRAFA